MHKYTHIICIEQALAVGIIHQLLAVSILQAGSGIAILHLHGIEVAQHHVRLTQVGGDAGSGIAPHQIVLTRLRADGVDEGVVALAPVVVGGGLCGFLASGESHAAQEEE